MIHSALAVGFVFFFFNWWVLALPISAVGATSFYTLSLTLGYICLLMAGVWMSRLLKNNLMDDVFNLENESFMQETRLMENEYSVNLPTGFYYRKRWNKGWINIVNPFRASMVFGPPGSGKSYAIVNNYIKQQIEKGFAMYICDYKFPDLSEIAYNHLLAHLDAYEVKPQFFVINFDDPRKSHRCNPINLSFMTDISDAYESAYTIMLNLNSSGYRSREISLWNRPSSYSLPSSGSSKFMRMASIAPFHTPLSFSIAPMHRYFPSSLPMMSRRTTFCPLWMRGRVACKTNCRDRLLRQRYRSHV